MTALQFQDSYTDASDPTYVYVTASTPTTDVSSVGKLYRSGGTVVSVYTAIIHVKTGEVEGITWDDGCFFCDAKSSDCIDTSFDWNGVAVTSGDLAGKGCAQTTCATDATECGLTLYTVWTGTDKDGRYFTSAGRRFSRFQQFNTATLYTSAKARALS